MPSTLIKEKLSLKNNRKQDLNSRDVYSIKNCNNAVYIDVQTYFVYCAARVDVKIDGFYYIVFIVLRKEKKKRKPKQKGHVVREKKLSYIQQEPILDPQKKSIYTTWKHVCATGRHEHRLNVVVMFHARYTLVEQLNVAKLVGHKHFVIICFITD